MEEKEKEKQRKAREKEERAKQRQVKKALKEQQKQQQQRPKSCPQKKASSRITFSEEELAKFTRRYENGYDIATDERYNAWLQIFHPTEGKTSVPCKSQAHMHVPSNYKYK